VRYHRLPRPAAVSVALDRDKLLHNPDHSLRPRARGPTLNSLLVLLNIESWKPVLTALILPPVPLLLLLLVGARLMLPRRGWGWLIIVLSVSLLWLSMCTGTGHLLTQFVLRPPPAMTAARIAELKAEARTKRQVAIVVLGGGLDPFAPEYGVSNLTPLSMERLRYGLWLNRETGASVAFSGGVGWAHVGSGTPEAQIGARIAAQEFGRPIKWVEDQSRDTRENAARSLPMLREAGIDHIVLVTHGWHMPRASRAFEQAAGGTIRIEPAPVGLVVHPPTSALTWLPTSEGTVLVRAILRELLGSAVGV
jgi:uncharacterized SAM-binding protein YcdF (DUF218 family)